MDPRPAPAPDPQPPTPTPDPAPLPPDPTSPPTAGPARRARAVPLSAATFALSRLIVHDKVETWLREPFVIEEGGDKRPRGRRLRYAVGELMSCTRCMGAWSALALVGLRLHAPRAGRTVTTVLATS